MQNSRLGWFLLKLLYFTHEYSENNSKRDHTFSLSEKLILLYIPQRKLEVKSFFL